MITPKDMWHGMDRSDQYMMLTSILIPLVVWWFLIGREKYSMRGMK